MQILPCPFCNSNKIDVNGNIYTCINCLATVRERWNHRLLSDISTDNLPIPTKLVDPWISVKDRTPHQGETILFCSIDPFNFVYTSFGLYLGDNFESHRFYSHDGIATNATHWQPLPEPPKELE